jgi:ABC-type transport system substrate-binding protein
LRFQRVAPIERGEEHGYKIAIMSTGAVRAYAGADMAPCAFTAGISTSGSGQMQPLLMNELVKEQLERVGFQVKLVPMDWNSLIDVYFFGANKNPTLDAINFSETLEQCQSPDHRMRGAFA